VALPASRASGIREARALRPGAPERRARSGEHRVRAVSQVEWEREAGAAELGQGPVEREAAAVDEGARAREESVGLVGVAAPERAVAREAAARSRVRVRIRPSSRSCARG